MEVVGGEARETETSITKRCEICCQQVWKYRCPACRVVTCCLQCVQEHKVKSGCTGVRNRAEFVPMKDYDDRHLLNDYRFLEETDRKSDSARREGPKYSRTAKRWCIVRRRAQKFHDIDVRFLPAVFTRHKANNTYCRADGSFCWSTEWQMADYNNLTVVAQHDDSMTLDDAFTQFLESKTCCSSVRAMYRGRQRTFQLKLEKVAGKRYEQVPGDQTICAVLRGKSLVEFPTFRVAYVKPIESESETTDTVMAMDNAIRDEPVIISKTVDSEDSKSKMDDDSLSQSLKSSTTNSDINSERLEKVSREKSDSADVVDSDSKSKLIEEDSMDGDGD